ncbi:hypothetical protein [Sodalis sp.]|uniref:hypothetical protein n=1 Tax=Sodalis sp. (in: enterobacteria) TaxID=1898979 RepID=UPI003872C8A9
MSLECIHDASTSASRTVDARQAQKAHGRCAYGRHPVRLPHDGTPPGLQAGTKTPRGAPPTQLASYGSKSSRSKSRTESRQSKGSTLTAGMDMKLDTGRDIILQSVQNIENTVE